MSYSAHVDRFAAERLPPRAQWPEFRFDLPELQYPERLNAAVALIDRAVDEGHGNRLALVSETARLTYAELKDRSDRIARVLVDDGLVPGGRVLLRGHNTAMLFATWAGVLKAGGIAVTTMPMLRAGELATIAERARVTHAIVDARTADDWTATARFIMQLPVRVRVVGPPYRIDSSRRIWGGDRSRAAPLCGRFPR